MKKMEKNKQQEISYKNLVTRISSKKLNDKRLIFNNMHIQ